jgi:protein-tyrosine kinase
MDRVSKALQRASEETVQPKKRPVDGQQNPVGNATDRYSPAKLSGQLLGVSKPSLIYAPDTSDDSVGMLKEVDSYAEGDGRSPFANVSNFHPKPWWRLPKTIEALLYGRKGRNLDTHSLIALNEKSQAGERYRILREQIIKSCREQRVRVVAVMSPIKGDGKTTVAANLAAAVALSYEQQALLIDADLRKPSIHQFFTVKSTPGLAEYLSSPSRTDLMNYIQKTSLSGLQILAGGKPTTLSAELLAKERMKILLREAPERFPGRLIIVDTPPVLSTSDPLVLAQQVEGIVMVVCAGKTPRACFSEAIISLGSSKVIGIILNKVDLGTASKYYYGSRS